MYEIKDETYLLAAMNRDFPMGYVMIGGSPDSVDGRWVATVVAEKRKGIFGGYIIREDDHYPSRPIPKEKTLTLAGATKRVRGRLSDLVQNISKETGLPIVDFEEAQRHNKRATEIAVERIRPQK